MRVERTEGLLAKGVWYGAGAGAASGVVGLGALLRFEAWRARRTVGEPTKAPPYLGGTYGTGLGRPVVLFVAGDSLAAGLGVRREETLVAHIARQLSERSHRPVHVISTAKVGARSADLAGQLGTGLHLYPRPDVSLLIIGANDVTHFHGLADAPRQLAAAVDRLRSVGSEVVVGTCPDIGTVEPIWQPLRGLAGKVSHEYAGRQENAAVEAGAHVVALGGELGKQFAEHPEEMFGRDGFHPSARGHAAGAQALLPAVFTAAAAKGLVRAPRTADGGRAVTRSVTPQRRSRLAAVRDGVRDRLSAGGRSTGHGRSGTGREAAAQERGG